MFNRNFWNPEQLSEMPPGNGVTYTANPRLPGDHTPQPAHPTATHGLTLAPTAVLTARGIFK